MAWLEVGVAETALWLPLLDRVWYRGPQALF
jgi:hypothetical protein